MSRAISPQPGAATARMRRFALTAALAVDAGHHAFGFLGAPVADQPARAFRHVAPHEKDRAPQHAAEEESEAPADVRADPVRLQEHDREAGAQPRADPESAVDREV